MKNEKKTDLEIVIDIRDILEEQNLLKKNLPF